jgi:hypothetical protein
MMRERSGDKWRAALLPLALALPLAGCAATTGGVSTTPKIAQTATPAASDTAPPSAPICQPSQLSTAFEMGSPATGNLTGSIWVWNTSVTACSLEGAVSFAGLDAHHQPIVGVKMNQSATLSLMELPPHTPALSPGVAPAPGAYLEWTILGAYRDDPNSANGLCASANEVTPAWFVVTVGAVSLSVKNYTAQSVVGLHAIEGCHGTILSGAPNLWS